MSRKKTQPKKNVVPDPKFNSTIIPKLINNIMYDGKRGVAAKIVTTPLTRLKLSLKMNQSIFSMKLSITSNLLLKLDQEE
jgi:ribosomal protein S7